jgi:hypothetical protein|tara:strand:- start:427 stop:825 length:399 start_codon:yes stop_codon:yes gene_type:complete
MEKIRWIDFQKLTADEIDAGPCLEVTFNGFTAFTVLVRPQQVMLDRARGMGNYIDMGKGHPSLPERFVPVAKPAPWQPLTPFDAEGNPIDPDLAQAHAAKNPALLITEGDTDATQRQGQELPRPAWAQEAQT